MQSESNKFFVDCACGEQIAVTPGQAGSMVGCPCGRESQVPGLSVLRRQMGQPEYVTNVVERIRMAQDRGELPGSTCVHCCRPTADVIHCRVVC